MGENLPIVIAAALGLIWIACIFSGMGSLYRRKSPLNIVYWGTWGCFALWYLKWIKNHPDMDKSPFVFTVIIIAVVLGATFAMFGSESVDDTTRGRRPPPKSGKHDE